MEERCAAVEERAVRGPRAMVFEKRALVDAHRGRIGRARRALLESALQQDRPYGLV